MDQRLRFLLRRFSLSGDPIDAINFANNSLRAGDFDATVWVLTTFDNREGDNEYGSGVELYFSELSALINAFQYAMEWFDNNEPGLSITQHSTFRTLLDEFKQHIDLSNLIGMRAILEQINAHLPRNVDISVNSILISD